MTGPMRRAATDGSHAHSEIGAAVGAGRVCVLSGELGVALSGGGAKALAQLGVLKVSGRRC